MKTVGLSGIFIASSTICVGAGAPAIAATPKECPPHLAADAPVVPQSMEQADINSGAVSFQEIVEHGETLFAARFNTCDGSGRPETTGGCAKRAIPTVSDGGEPVSAGQMNKLRTPAPDEDSCAGCHNQPKIGGHGDFVANVFVLAQALDPVTFSVS